MNGRDSISSRQYSVGFSFKLLVRAITQPNVFVYASLVVVFTYFRRPISLGSNTVTTYTDRRYTRENDSYFVLYLSQSFANPTDARTRHPRYRISLFYLRN